MAGETDAFHAESQVRTVDFTGGLDDIRPGGHRAVFELDRPVEGEQVVVLFVNGVFHAG